jgi:DNA-binding response OmpR family regulator
MKRILLVDDEPDITNSLKIGLEDSGFVVDAFNDSVLALSNFKADVYDPAFLDVKMQRLMGLSYMKR